MLSIEQQKQLADEVSRSAAQKAAVLKALSRVEELVVSDRQPDTISVAPRKPKHPTVIAVVSGNTVADYKAREVWPLLDRALERFGAVELVTFGGQGAERAARRWAKAREQEAIEFATCFNVLQGDGTTVTDTRAIGNRNRRLTDYLEGAQTPIALLYGEGDKDDPSMRRALAVFDVLVKGGCYHAGRPVPTQAQLDERLAQGAAQVDSDEQPADPAAPEDPSENGSLAAAVAGLEAAIAEGGESA